MDCEEVIAIFFVSVDVFVLAEPARVLLATEPAWPALAPVRALALASTCKDHSLIKADCLTGPVDVRALLIA